jgi:hypothetical protein
VSSLEVKATNRQDHVDRKQAREFEGFVTESGDALLRMATLLTTDPDLAEATGPTAIRLTAAQHALYKLSSAAAGTARPGGRYVILAERQDNYERTSVVDSLTGDVWTYQRGAGVPSELPVARHDSPTAASSTRCRPTPLPCAPC